jgi:hypothetical protein
VSQGFKPELIETRVGSLLINTVMDSSFADTPYGVATLNSFSEESAFHNGFIMTFPYRIHFIGGRTFEDFKRYVTVTVGNKAVEIRSIELDNNILKVFLVDDVKGGNTVTISFKYFHMVTVIPNGCYAAVTQSYSWSLPLPTFRRSHNEGRITASVDGSLIVDVRPIITTDLPIFEPAPVGVSSVLTCEVKEIITHDLPVKEDIVTSLHGTLTAEVSLVGTSPV